MDDWTLIYSEIDGFAIGKPPGWVLLTGENVAENRRRIRLDNPEMAQRIQELAAAPLVAMARYPADHPDLNPTVQVALRPLGPMAGAGALDILNAMAGPMGQMMDEFTLEEAPHPVTVAGREAAAMRATCVFSNADGMRFPVRARTWVVPREEFVFVIGMSDKAHGSEVPDGVFQEILGSIIMEE